MKTALAPLITDVPTLVLLLFLDRIAAIRPQPSAAGAPFVPSVSGLA